MPAVTSKDGTRIAYETTGSGPALILVDGALCFRASGPARPLAAQLADRFAVTIYDRRGRGESTDTAPYAIEREVEDLEAIVNAVGGKALVYGISSGAALALAAANRLPSITRLAVYEAPFIVDDTRQPLGDDYVREYGALLPERRSEAVAHFMKAVGVPAFGRAIMRLLPVWKVLKGVAHTLPYDTALVTDCQRGRPLDKRKWSNVKAPTLVIAGGKSPAWMKNAAHAVAKAIPHAAEKELPGQNHMVSPKAIAPVLREFFSQA